MTESEARFTINVREGLVELAGNETFVDKHLEKFEEIFKVALRDAIAKGMAQNLLTDRAPPLPEMLVATRPTDVTRKTVKDPSSQKQAAKSFVNVPPIPVDLKASESKPGLREFYSEKKPITHYEKAALFVYYLTKFNKLQDVRFGEILSCYEEVDEKKPSILDIVKNSIRYKGWLEGGMDRYSCRLTISGENFIKFDLPTSLKNKQSQAALV